jgi:hypothetical protein
MPLATPELRREYARRWSAARRAAYFADKACARCGSTDGMQLHHVYQETKAAHCIWSWSQARRERELAKCIILCGACHKEETTRQRARPIRHGTTRGYRRGCRCDACREATVSAERERKRRKAEAMGDARFERATPAV